MRENVDAPMPRECPQRTDVIEVAVREQDVLRPRVFAEAVRDFANDRARRAAEPRIDKAPVIRPRFADEVDVDDQMAKAGDIRRNLVQRPDA
jgi:hypothetical protein